MAARRPVTRRPAGRLIVSAIVVLLLASGWYGGTLAYKHKIGAVDGVSPESAIANTAAPPREPCIAG